MNKNITYKPHKPIVINKSAIALIHIFTKRDSIEDCWMFDTNYIESLNNK